MSEENKITDTEDRKVTSRNIPHQNRVLIEIKNLVNENYPDEKNPCFVWHSKTTGLTKRELEGILGKTKWLKMVDDNIIVETTGQTGGIESAINRAVDTLINRGYNKKYFFEILIGKGWTGLDDIVDRFLEKKQIYLRPKFMRAIKRNQIIVIGRKNDE